MRRWRTGLGGDGIDFVIEDFYVEEVGGRVAGKVDAVELEICARAGVDYIRHPYFRLASNPSVDPSSGFKFTLLAAA